MFDEAKEFFSQVKKEVFRVTWPSRKEAVTSSITVFIAVAVASVFFVLVDMLIYKFVQFLLSYGG